MVTSTDFPQATGPRGPGSHTLIISGRDYFISCPLRGQGERYSQVTNPQKSSRKPLALGRRAHSPHSPTYRLPLNLKKAHFGDNLGPKGLATKGLSGVHAPAQKVPTHLPGKCAAWRKLRLLLGLTSQQPVHQTCVYSLNGT